MPSKHKPSIEELKKAHAAESKKISDLIKQGYDFEEEHEGNKRLFKAWLGDSYSSEAMARNRKLMKEEKKK